MEQEYEKLIKAFHQMKRSMMHIKCSNISNVELMTLGVIAHGNKGCFHSGGHFQKEELSIEKEESTISENEQGIKVSELAKKLHTSKPDISKKIKNLEEKELVKREGDPKDKRVTYVSLTEKGLAEYKAARGETQVMIENVLRRLGKEEVENFILLLEKLNASIYEEVEQRKGEK